MMDTQELDEQVRAWIARRPTPPGLHDELRASFRRARLEVEAAAITPSRTITERRWHLPGKPQWPLATGLIAIPVILLLVSAAIVLLLHRGSAIGPTPPLRAAVPVVSDVPVGNSALPAIERVSGAGAMHLRDDGAFRPNAPVLRVEMAAISIRTSGLALRPGPPVTPPIADDELRRSYDTLVSLTLVNGAYAPTDEVLRIQVVSFIARTMVKAGRWSPVMIDDPAIYPDVLPESGHRLDLLTYMRNAGAIPGLPTTQSWPGFDQVADRGWVAQVVAPLVPPAAFAPFRAMQVPLGIASLAIVDSRRGTEYHRG